VNQLESGTQEPDAGRPGFKRLTQFAMGNAGKNALASMIEIYGLYYCTEVLGLAPGLAGLVIMLSLAWDAIADPLIGYAADRRISRHPTILPFFLVGMPSSALAFLAFFHSAELPGSLHVAAIVLSLIVFRTAYTLVDIPHNCLLVFAARHPQDRASLAGLRIFFSAVGKLAITVLAAWLLEDRAAGDTASGFASLSFAATAIFIVALGLSARSARFIQIPSYRSQAAFPLRAAWGMFGSEPRLRTALTLTALNSLCTPSIGVGLIFISISATGAPELGAKAVVAHAAAQAVAPLVWNGIAKLNPDRRQLMIAAYALLALACLVGCLMPIKLLTLTLFAAVSGFAMGGAFMLNWAYFADAIEAAQGKADVSMTMSYFGIYAITNKVCHGAAQSLTGLAVAFATASMAGGWAPVDKLRVPIFVLTIFGCLMCSAQLVRRR
jgi:GPH family glycoside/pentoside/hexuronide:cation symporter